jgi:hypothetical protein
MHADCRIEIGIGRRQDGGSCATGREPGGIDPFFVHRIVGHDLAREARDQCRLALAAGLIARAKPVPALGNIGRSRLLRVSNKAVVFLGAQVHPRACGKVVRRLRAAVQHDDQRQRLTAILARNIEFVGSASGVIAEGFRQELTGPGLWNVWRSRFRQSARTGLKSGRSDPVEKTPQRIGQLRPDCSFRPAVRGVGYSRRHARVKGRIWTSSTVQHALQQCCSVKEPPRPGKPGCFTHAGVQSGIHSQVSYVEGSAEARSVTEFARLPNTVSQSGFYSRTGV